ncbi:MAG: iron-sulfur cluster assembly accessory protein [Hahellaceae bacterium]|nr:iron-sulfur cluster assembly accessory protein [Hahellaceae bacterium]MCP5211043.1 iron-sulfur cluster assembly accessory protein [Hahellaceae bacterium]
MTVEQFVPVKGITMTAAACTHTRKQLAQHPQALGIRIEIKKSGCSGYMYETELASSKSEDDQVFKVGEGVEVYIKSEYMGLLGGTEIDFVREGLNSTFVFRNPNATAECGCGESFTIS